MPSYKKWTFSQTPPQPPHHHHRTVTPHDRSLLLTNTRHSSFPNCTPPLSQPPKLPSIHSTSGATALLLLLRSYQLATSTCTFSWAELGSAQPQAGFSSSAPTQSRPGSGSARVGSQPGLGLGRPARFGAGLGAQAWVIVGPSLVLLPVNLERNAIGHS